MYVSFYLRLEGSGVFIALATVCVRLLEVHLFVCINKYVHNKATNRTTEQACIQDA